MTEGTRWTHMVGGYPGVNARDVMTTVLEALGATLPTLPDGERPTEANPARDQWIAPELARIADAPGTLVHNPFAGHTSYEDTSWYEAGRALTAEDFREVVILQRAFLESYPVFQEVRRDYGLSGLRFQQGLPAPLDVAYHGFRRRPGDKEFEGLHEPVVQAKARQVRACHEAAAGDVVFQIESVAAPALTARAAGPDKTAADVARLLASLPACCPGTAWGVHLCLGDFHYSALTDPDSARPLVALANEIAAQWPAGAALEYIHVPMAAASKPPSLDRAWYSPLRDLKLPAGARLAAGFVHEKLSLGQLSSVMSIIEDAYGDEVTIAASCGLGRRPDPRQSADVLAKMAALARA